MILTKPMLKNVKKFNEIKLERGLVLNNSATKIREGEIGISSEQYGDKWFMLPKGKAIFKTYKSIIDDDLFKNIRNIRITNELLCQELAKQVGVLCAEYELATKKNITGLVTYDIAKPGEEIIDSYSFFYNIKESDESKRVYKDDVTFQDYAEAIDIYKINGYKIDKQKTLKTLYKIILFDCLTVQSDRHSGNLFFLHDPIKQRVKLSPLMDNEFAFNTKNFDNFIHQLTELKNNTKNSFIESLNYLSDQINVQDVSFSMSPPFLQNAKEIVNIAVQNEEYARIFKRIIQAFNVKKAINNLKLKGVEISAQYENYILTAEKQVKSILKTFLKQKQSQKNPKAEDYEYDFLKKEILQEY